MSLLTVAAAVPAAKAIHAGDTPASTANYGRGRGVGRARGAGVTLGAGVGVAVGVGVGVAHGVNVYVRDWFCGGGSGQQMQKSSV